MLEHSVYTFQYTHIYILCNISMSFKTLPKRCSTHKSKLLFICTSFQTGPEILIYYLFGIVLPVVYLFVYFVVVTYINSFLAIVVAALLSIQAKSTFWLRFAFSFLNYKNQIQLCRKFDMCTEYN